MRHGEITFEYFNLHGNKIVKTFKNLYIAELQEKVGNLESFQELKDQGVSDHETVAIMKRLVVEIRDIQERLEKLRDGIT